MASRMSLVIALAIAATVATTTASSVTVTFASVPAPPKIGDNTFEVTVTDGDGNDIHDAEVTVVLRKGAKEPISEIRNELKLERTGQGKYTGSASLPSAGDWKVTIDVTRGGKPLAQKQLTLAVK